MPNNLQVIKHPLIQTKLTKMRDKRTTNSDFRDALKQISVLMSYEIFKSLPTKEIPVTTPVADTAGERLQRDIVFIPILRAGLGMLDGFHMVHPEAKVGHIGMDRDESSFIANAYYFKMPDNFATALNVVIDPMLATGGSAIKAIRKLQQEGARYIVFVSLIAAPEGVEAMHASCPEVPLFTAALDSHLNEKAYIIPGLGDAGDRIFGTE
jgi:uracil phosphoribosyltransferase